MNCDHLLCQFLSELERDRAEAGEPSQDRYSEPTATRCRLSEPSSSGMSPYLADGDEQMALAWLRIVDPQLLRREVDRITLIRATRGLAKFVAGAPGNRSKLVGLVDDAIRATGPGTGTPKLEQDGTRAMRERLEQLGVIQGAVR